MTNSEWNAGNSQISCPLLDSTWWNRPTHRLLYLSSRNVVETLQKFIYSLSPRSHSSLRSEFQLYVYFTVLSFNTIISISLFIFYGQVIILNVTITIEPSFGLNVYVK